MGRCIGFNPITCKFVVNQNVINKNKRFFEKNDFILVYISGKKSYQGTPKINPADYGKFKNVYKYDYFGIPYVAVVK